MGDITELIDMGNQGSGVDNAALFNAAYAELKKLAHARLSRSGPLTLLDSTALVNEIWLRLSGKETLQVDTRRRFFAYAAQVMRTVIVDQLRERHALRRGGGERAITLNTALGDGVAGDDEALQVHEALESLAQLEPRLAQVVEMRYFGGMTEVEVKERKDRVDDALHATRAAVEEGIVPGGGTALLYATKALEGLKGANDDQTKGIDIVRKAILSPIRQIAQNAGHDGAVISGNLLREGDESMGFNAATDTYENLKAAGVIDPTKVVRTALQDAASVAGLLITTEAAISERPDDKPSMGGMPGGGMGGMGGMDF